MEIATDTVLERKKNKKIQCAHCGDQCISKKWKIESNIFCCAGCKTVFEILHENKLDQFYKLNQNAGTSRKEYLSQEYEYLDDEEIGKKLINHTEGSNMTVWLSLPSIHCSSCLWLLENTHKINSGIKRSTVNFLEKKALIQFDSNQITLRQLADLLSSIGYPPHISFNDSEGGRKQNTNRKLLYKLGVSGFAFGNIMLLSFPEYLGLHELSGLLSKYIRYINLLLILPVVFYCSTEYLQSAWRGLSQKHLNIDVPISLGIIALFFKSIFDVFTGLGPGYFDSLAGLIFFLLIGKWFQTLTFQRIRFDLDYKSYFPISASLVDKEKKEKKVGLQTIIKGSILRIRNGEIIPADGQLLSTKAKIDYSFVTGESDPINISNNAKIYCGGKVIGPMIEMKVDQGVSTSYLTQLWNDSTFNKNMNNSSISALNETVAKYFTISIISISILAFIFHSFSDLDKAFHVFATVLIIACPCAVALSMPFVFGNIIRLFSQKNIYFKNTNVIENCSKINSIVFDKTGTITQVSGKKIKYIGTDLNEYQKKLIASLTGNSIHALSKSISQLLETQECFMVESYNEINGLGIEGIVDGKSLKIGSRKFILKENNELKNRHLAKANVIIQIEDNIVGGFVTKSKFRKNLHTILALLDSNYKLNLISGDNNNDEKQLRKIFPNWQTMHFRQSPFDKLQFIKSRQSNNEKIAMIGDGLNDAGALSQSHVGISITENTSNFTPACDIIVGAENFSKIPTIFTICNKAIVLIYILYSIAIIYNIIGIGFAVQGLLSPVVAAILMPLSSISIVILGLLSSTILFRSKF